jgi:hypothetical protein
MTEEDVAELLKESMHTPQGYNRIKQMNLYIEPAWHSENKTPYFLRCDVKNWINLLGGDIPKKEKTWREQLKRMLIMEGLSAQKAENYSRHSFPNEGTSLTVLVEQILELEDVDSRGHRVRQMSPQELDSRRQQQATRESEVEGLLRARQVQLDSTGPLAYRALVQQYASSGRGSAEQVVESIERSVHRHQNLLSALDQRAKNIPPNPLQ